MPPAEAALDNARSDPLICELLGPNDGEPINGRIFNLKLRTNYEGHGWISVSVNDVYLYRRALYLNSELDEVTGLLVSNLDVDVEKALRNAREASFVTVTVYLYGDDANSRLIALREWEGYLGLPWIEFLPKAQDPGSPGGDQPGTLPNPMAPQGLRGMVVHPLRTDSYFVFFGSIQRDALFLSPDNPRVFNEARALGSGSCFPYGPDSNVKNVVYLDTSLESSPRQVYVVLWTYDTSGGWRHSAIMTVP